MAATSRWSGLLWLALLAGAVQAQTSAGEALQLLQRVQTAAARLNYSGTFVYMQQGGQPQTSRITHVYDNGQERERLDILDGTPLVVVRTNDQTKSYALDAKVVTVEKRSIRGAFPGLVTEQVAAIAEHYEIRKGESARVAGLDSHVLHLEARDRMRYSHKLWVEVGSGLLLRAQMINERGEVVEHIAFTQVDIGGPAEKYASRLGRQRVGRDWRTAVPQFEPARLAEAGWHIESPFPGFRKVLELKRGIGDAEVGQVVFSDGLASVSVFIEPIRAGAQIKDGASAQGSVNVYRRRVGDHQVTVLGEAPSACVSRIARAIEYRPAPRP
ncbi:MAG: MucB/RseB C-terminal domain-containing protein [Burkholderiales bacterium]|nr:MucB/RseB C-terminal domain-containing protein [Burkholderiales bacterium]